MAFLDDHGRRTLRREMTTLAAELAAEGEVRLKLARRTEKYMQHLPARAAVLESTTGLEALRQLSGSARMLQSCARKARLGQGAHLPACGKYARIKLIAEKLIRGGDRAVDAASMQLALAAFDDAQGLNMSEYWAFHEALRIAVCEAAAEAAEILLSAGKAHVDAIKWAEAQGREDELQGRAPAFYERALQIAMDTEDPALRLRLENALARQDMSPEGCVRLAQERRALACTRIQNLMTSLRELEAADWLKAFEAASCTETELRCDPSGVYQAMTAESRDAVRRQVAIIARCVGAGETTVARYAVNAARENHGDVLRGGICWWLYDDEGRALLAKRLGYKKKLPRMVPDPKGRIIMVSQAGVTLGVCAGVAAATGACLWAIPAFPLAWSIAGNVIAQVVTRIVKPRQVLRLEFENLPEDARTLVAIPALLSSAQRADEMCRQLETLGCLERDKNLDFVLLGDLPDAESRDCESDYEIVEAARDGIARLNAHAERAKYHFLYRMRSYASADGIWRGEERKRGALMALCRLVTGRRSGAFIGAEAALFGGFRYIVTLDADTKMLPGTAHALVGTIAHPLNALMFSGLERRGFAVIQPRAELDAAECRNSFVKVFAGAGGMSAYSGMASDMYNDLTGNGAYCGKAVLDAPAFLEMLDGKLDGGRILSHDFIEGIIAGAGHVNDISLFDGFPGDLNRYLQRLGRWTRGDWQLIPELFTRLPAPGRFRIISNLIDSLREASAIALVVLSVWLGSENALATALLLMAIMPVFAYLVGDRLALRRVCAEFAVLPAIAYCRLDAVVRAVYRMCVSKRKLLEWVTSADDSGGKNYAMACRACAILLIPGVVNAGWFMPAAALAVIFLMGPGMLLDMAKNTTRRTEAITLDERATLHSLAEETWRFFAENVDETTNFLPPDNYQLEPGPVTARRTSPTNIAMYMLSCVSAAELGIISREDRDARLRNTADTLRRMDKWRGHIYNWVSTDDLKTLRPAYVSAVDSGNLAAALILCAQFTGGKLSEDMLGLAANMELSALYDKGRDLFYIGADVENGRLSASHYDLIASEARILSYAALMLGQIPVKHWQKLGRPVSGDTLMSWSGTMFEYLMPYIFMDSAPDTLLGKTYAGVVRMQKDYAAARSRPWGISESGYYAFDMQMNYQYRAFGLRALSMGGASPQDVVAPYAASLAAQIDVHGAVKNITEMRKKGWYGDYGMYEAIDFVRREPRPVKSWMAHHQGMTLCALCNVLTGGRLREAFMNIPEARALELLLNERAAVHVKLRPMEDTEDYVSNDSRRHGMRAGRASGRLADVCILGGGGACGVVPAAGGITYRRNGMLAARSGGDMLRRRDGMFTMLYTGDEGIRLDSGAAKCAFGPGEAVFTVTHCGIDAQLKMCIAPEDGVLIKYLRLENTSDKSITVQLIDGFEAMLMNEGEMRSHPAFFRLFLKADLSRGNTIIYRRTPREKGVEYPVLFHTAVGGVCLRETDWRSLMSREGTINRVFSGRDGAQTDPCSALCMTIELAAGEKAEAAFCTGICGEGELKRVLARLNGIDNVQRAAQPAAAYVRSAADFAGLDGEKRVLAERTCAVLMDPRLLKRQGEGGEHANFGNHRDMPCVCVTVDGAGATDVVRDAVRMHGFLRLMGFYYRIILINDGGGDYRQPARDSAAEIIDASHLRDMRGSRDGVDVYDGATLGEAELNAFMRSACLTFDGRSGYWQQLRRQLMPLGKGEGGALIPEKAADIPECYAENTDGTEFTAFIGPGCLPPAPRANIITAGGIGMLITERGGGFIWHKNSRLGRVTAFDNDPVHEGWSTMIYASDDKGRYLCALPGEKPMTGYTVRHKLHESVFACGTDEYGLETAVYAEGMSDTLRFTVRLTCRAERSVKLRISMFMDWLMGADGSDAVRTRTWNRAGAVFASGAIPGTAFMACDAVDTVSGTDRNTFLGSGGVMRPDGLMKKGDGGCALITELNASPEHCGEVTFTVGVRDTAEAAEYAANECKKCDAERLRAAARAEWEKRREMFAIKTGDADVDGLVNGFLIKQVLDGRIRGRAGLYQAGGAYGFRDQLQDMLALMPYEPDMVRGHILACAARQFEDGDVMHWWHPPMTGVRTRISDDLLFLPFVTAAYVRTTGDKDILDCEINYLENIDIPEGREDIYAEMRVSPVKASLRDHCLRALKRAYRTGEHGLLLMGSGDWNDGMNRLGIYGRGESVWLSMFYGVCARHFAELPGNDEERIVLEERSAAQLRAVEESGWDGEWYLRAYDDAGRAVGSKGNRECEIDLLSQAWAAMCGCGKSRSGRAVDAAWERLYVPGAGLIKLLTPPFDGKDFDSGYISAYPAGVRENGGQYTHAACWFLCALGAQGDTARAAELMCALLPMNHDTDIYRVEPYVMAADIYGEEPFTGRGGWTWYTGSAGWFLCAVRMLLGYERRGDRVRMNAMHGLFQRPEIRLKYGSSTYILISDPDAECISVDGKIIHDKYVRLTDDGQEHTCIFPQRRGSESDILHLL